MNELLINTLQNLNPYLTLIGAISAVLSIISFIGSWKQVRIAKDAANRAVAVRDAMVDRKGLADISALSQRMKALLRRTEKISSIATEKLVKGLNLPELASDVDNMTSEILRYRDNLSPTVIRSFDKYIKSIRTNLSALVEASSFAKTKEHGTEVHECVRQLSIILDRHLDKHTNKLPTSLIQEVL